MALNWLWAVKTVNPDLFDKDKQTMVFLFMCFSRKVEPHYGLRIRGECRKRKQFRNRIKLYHMRYNFILCLVFWGCLCVAGVHHPTQLCNGNIK